MWKREKNSTFHFFHSVIVCSLSIVYCLFLMKTVMAFGTFDDLHPGHEHFLKEARALGDQLIVVVARDKSVRELKHREPKYNEETRRHAVEKLTLVSKAVLGDDTLGTYEVILRHHPNIIALGHDQSALAEDLHRWLSLQTNAAELVTLTKL